MKHLFKRKTDIKDKRLPSIMEKKFKVFGYKVIISKHTLDIENCTYKNEININISKGWEG